MKLIASTVLFLLTPLVSAQDSANLRTIVSGGSLVQPVGLVAPAGDSNRMYVVQLNGVVRLMIKSGIGPAATYALRPAPVLDITASTVTGGERGLFSIAFDPSFATNGYLYVCRTIDVGGQPHGAVERFTRSDTDPDGFDPASRLTIWTAPQPALNHCGGQINFGSDGLLYVSRGDAANSANPQDVNSPLGKIIRLDVSGDDFPADPQRNYRVPADNPFASGGGGGGLPEIWAKGLRNPWRWSVDRWNGDMLIADVGDSRWEEVNWVAGNGGPLRDYGWPLFEGNRVALAGSNPAGRTFPIYAYPHAIEPGFSADMTGFSISGGYVYRGAAVRTLRGRYVFTDFVSCQVWSASLDNGVWSDFRVMTGELLTTVGGTTPPGLVNVAALGEDGEGELYVLELFAPSRIRKLEPEGPQALLADLGQQGGLPGADGNLDNNDFVAFIDFFFSGNWRADLGVQGGVFGADHRLDNNDFVVFIEAFFLQL